ncbi:beta-ketoacyl-[acyl-carrier-protein] synthase family protein [Streptomyces cacaoi]|uniref:3-oxoacyl-[acyl-carrier-protein] synthase 2 n=2 Tax=Streptomyces cacaoi TaxID=1898 RepID=A0A4Y3R6T0_STRCI|nr:beta-ketoacyl-[acyl-carrier-protein] synthase family protein [Streptomyces cacaoi]NNG88732.1 beta-ketoacyl-[acyl-carrier-protein] synthase family protein [Streptomyces cacaoi]GEB52467.1 3-oxoacyl-[acyl-carrier-protein] synthase 2 [Streptomyces cacaoi]
MTTERTTERRPGRSAVSVTGIGVVTPAGCTPEDLWAALRAGRSTATALDRPELARHRVRIGCPVRGLDAASAAVGVTGKEARRMDPFAVYGTTAALSAHRDAGAPAPDPARTALVVGNAVGGRTVSDRESALFTEGGPHRVNPLMPLLTMPNAAAAHLAMRLGWTGPALTVATTCASGADAVGHALALLRADRADVVIAGGCEATLTPVTLAGFGNLGAVSLRNDEPARACRPFDADRDGFVMGEGSAFVVLERTRDAVARGARRYAEVAGYASGTDAYHLSMPQPDGACAAEVMSAALADAGLAPADVAHINAHGTATEHNDRAEAEALHKVFGSRTPPVTATKSVVGHLIGAAGAVELVAAVQAMRAGEVPPTANHERQEPGMDIDVVHGTPRTVAPGPALSNSFGFGGHNAALVVVPS